MLLKMNLNQKQPEVQTAPILGLLPLGVGGAWLKFVLLLWQVFEGALP